MFLHYTILKGAIIYENQRTFIPVFTLSVALLLTACNGKEAADTKKTQTTQTESGTEAVTGSVAESGTETAGASGTKLDDLYQQENQIFADHADVWNKVFGMMNKSTADQAEIMRIIWQTRLKPTRILFQRTS